MKRIHNNKKDEGTENLFENRLSRLTNVSSATNPNSTFLTSLQSLFLGETSNSSVLFSEIYLPPVGCTFSSYVLSYFRQTFCLEQQVEF